MTTIKEIAEQAKVSVATVSNVLNGKGGASEEKAAQIREIAHRLNYTPNILAKNLKRKRTNTIGIITEDLTVFNTPEIVDGIDEYCERNDFNIVLGNLRFYKHFKNNFTETEPYRRMLDNAISSLMSRQVEALIYVGCHCREIYYKPELLQLPMVFAYSFSSQESIASVIYDDESAAYQTTKLLIDNGHRKIGMICGPFGSRHAQIRTLGYQQALYESGILYNHRMVVYGDWGHDDGYRCAEQLTQEGVTAIFAQNDIMASGVYEYCGDHGIEIGSGLSLIGFDNRDLSQTLRPKLSTCALPLFEIGQRTAQLAIDAIHGTPHTGEHIKIPCRLLERDSVGKLML